MEAKEILAAITSQKIVEYRNGEPFIAEKPKLDAEKLAAFLAENL